MEKGGFNAAKFPYTTKDPELLEGIMKKLKTQEEPEASQVARLSEPGKGTNGLTRA